MVMIEKLTPQQEGKLPEYAEKWLKIGLCTDAADKPRAESAIVKMYEMAGKKAPVFVWSQSPMEQAIKRASAEMFSIISDENIDKVKKSIKDKDETAIRLIKHSIYQSAYGCHDAYWLGFYDFFMNECGIKLPQLEGLLELSKSAGWVIPFENVCFMSERPEEIHMQKIGSRNVLHNTSGPSIRYRDGYSVYSISGIRVTEQIVMRPETITISQINKEENSEIRRIMIERYGYEKYLRNSDAKLIDSCGEDHPIVGLRTAKLWEIDDIVLLDVLNSTPEPDGSVKRYVIAIDPNQYDERAGKECLAASASTWRKRNDKTQLVFATPEDYLPGFES